MEDLYKADQKLINEFNPTELKGKLYLPRI